MFAKTLRLFVLPIVSVVLLMPLKWCIFILWLGRRWLCKTLFPARLKCCIIGKCVKMLQQRRWINTWKSLCAAESGRKLWKTKSDSIKAANAISLNESIQSTFSPQFFVVFVPLYSFATLPLTKCVCVSWAFHLLRPDYKILILKASRAPQRATNASFVRF